MPSACNESKYKTYRNKLNHILKKAEKQHYTDLLEANKNNIKYEITEVWIINHCLGLGHETMVCAVCLTMFLLKKLGKSWKM